MIATTMMVAMMMLLVWLMVSVSSCDPIALAGRQLQLVETGFMILQKKFKGTGTAESGAKVPVDD